MKPPRFIETHPESHMGNPNYAYLMGYDLIAIRPNRLMIYRRVGWLRRYLRTFG